MFEFVFSTNQAEEIVGTDVRTCTTNYSIQFCCSTVATETNIFLRNCFNFSDLQMNVEIAPSADIPWPPPLEEAVEENTHKEYAEETGTSPRQVKQPLSLCICLFLFLFNHYVSQ